MKETRMTTSTPARGESAADLMDLRGHTMSMTARTESMSYQPSRTALAARSWGVVRRITDPTKQREAMTRHFDRFPPAIEVVHAGR
jgi:hypothetical protein